VGGLGAGTRGLDHDHAEVVSDDVVQLAGDARPLLGARDLRFALKHVRPRRQGGGVAPAADHAADHDPREPSSTRQHQEERPGPTFPA
jgi:hypothetical protein